LVLGATALRPLFFRRLFVQKPEEYRGHAKECRGLAAKTKAGEQRDSLLKMAQSWDRLADECERKSPVEEERGTGEGIKDKLA